MTSVLCNSSPISQKCGVAVLCPLAVLGTFAYVCQKNNIYRPPRDINENYRQFIDEFTTVLAKLERSHSGVVSAGDFNIDLLKIREKTIFGDYFDAITGDSFFPKITPPTRFSNMNGTLIDNFLYKISHRLLITSAGIIPSRISDHLPYFVSLDYVNIKLKNITKFIQVKQQNASNLNNFKAELSRTNVLTNFDLSIDADPNRNYDILEHTITSAINKNLPTKTITFNNINTNIQTELHRVLSSQFNIGICYIEN